MGRRTPTGNWNGKCCWPVFAAKAIAIPDPYLCLDFSKATLKPPPYPYLCCDYSRATLVPQRT